MKWISLVAFTLLASACTSASPGSTPGESTTTLPQPPAVVLTITEDGGCFMMGPNCATYLIYSDGSVTLERTDDPGVPVDTGTIDTALVGTVIDLVAATDLDALQADLPPGECRGCYDGIDVTFTYETPEGPVAIASIDVDIFASDEPLLTATWSILDAATADLELPIATRP